MADLTFSQSERRSYLVPALIAVVVLAAFLGFFYLRTPMRIADGTVTHTAVLPTHTVFKTGSKVVGAQETAEDDLYVLASVQIDNHLKVPLFISDITGAVTTTDDNVTTTSAIEKNDLANLYFTFPALKPLASDPLLRESAIRPGEHAEGMVLLAFPLTESDWNSRKSAAVTVEFEHQGSITIAITK
jgi:hypothetical protein